MDAFDVLHQMHEEAKATFQKIEQAPANERAGLWAKLRPELTLHEQIEERFVYDPVASDARGRNPDLEAWEQQHNQQVRQAEAIIGRIGDLDVNEAAWLLTVKELKTTLEGHIRTEETEMWPKIRQFWGDEKLQKAGGQVQAAKTAGSMGAAVSGAVGSAVQSVKDAAGSITNR